MTLNLPKGWMAQSLGDIATLNMGQSPKSEVVNDKGIGLPFFQGNAEFGDVSPITRKWTDAPLKTANAGDILFSVRAPVGEMNVASENCCIGRGLSAIRANGVEHCFLLHALSWSKKSLASLSQGSTFTAINKAQLSGLQLLVPPLPEQKKIAEVLSSVDEAVAATKAVIDQTKQVKKGLLQTLLTKGIGHTKFKPLPQWIVGKVAKIEEIPDSWELVNLNDVAKLESGHTPSRNVGEYWDGGIPWISLHDTKRLGVRELSETTLNISQMGLDNSSARLLPKGTVVFSRTASVGNCVIMAREMATSQDFANYICGPHLCNRYLLHLFRWMQHVWSNLSSGSTHQTIYMPTFKALQILLPPREEQEKIARISDSFDDFIAENEAKLNRLQAVKIGLMSDLLSGRKRVEV